MKGITLTVATLGLVYAAAALPTPTAKTVRSKPAAARLSGVQDQSNPQQPEPKELSRTISKSGEQFVLGEAGGNSPYKLDDQQAAGKHEGKKAKVTGTVDAADSLIRVQTVEEAPAS